MNLPGTDLLLRGFPIRKVKRPPHNFIMQFSLYPDRAKTLGLPALHLALCTMTTIERKHGTLLVHHKDAIFLTIFK
jgi:hypothetical protein